MSKKISEMIPTGYIPDNGELAIAHQGKNYKITAVDFLTNGYPVTLLDTAGNSLGYLTGVAQSASPTDPVELLGQDGSFWVCGCTDADDPNNWDPEPANRYSNGIPCPLGPAVEWSKGVLRDYNEFSATFPYQKVFTWGSHATLGDLTLPGDYPDLRAALVAAPHSRPGSLAINVNTRLVIWSGKNFTGDIILDKTGPFLLINSYVQPNYGLDVWTNNILMWTRGQTDACGRSLDDVFEITNPALASSYSNLIYSLDSQAASVGITQTSPLDPVWANFGNWQGSFKIREVV
jgi:hypothetical protein